MNIKDIAAEASLKISVMRNRALKGDESIDSQQIAIIEAAIEKATEDIIHKLPQSSVWKYVERKP